MVDMAEIKIQSVDYESIEKDSSFEEAYSMVVSLNETPAYEWTNAFSEAWEHMIFFSKRQHQITGNNIKLIFAKDDDIQIHIDFLRRVINYTNKRYGEFEKELKEKQKRLEEKQSMI